MERAKRLAILSAGLALTIGGWTDPAAAQTKPVAAGSAHYVIGKPYQFDGVWYQPAVDYGYDASGVASVYPARPAGLSTTSGEPYDESAVAAAHKTLPLPSLVLVTNLDNGKSIKLRINDRGPFVDDRIIELTPAAAILLGMSDQATAHVRIQIMAGESQALAATLSPSGGGSTGGSSVSPAPAPVVKVTSLPLLTGPAVQPLRPVAAPAPTAPATVSAPAPIPAPVPLPAAVPISPAPAPVIAAAPAPPAAPIPLALPPSPTKTVDALIPPTLPLNPAPAATAPIPPVVPPAPAKTVDALIPPTLPLSPAPAPTAVIPPAVPPAPTKTVDALIPPTLPLNPAPAQPAPAPAVSVTITNSAGASSTDPAAGASPVTQTASVPGSAAAPPSSPILISTPVATPTPAATSSATLLPVANTGGAVVGAIPGAASNTSNTKPLPLDLPAQFFIQTGAFKAPAEADRLRTKLAGMGPAKIVPTHLGGDQFNAVLLGPIPSMAEAQRLLKQISAMGYSDAVLIIE